MNDIKNCVQLHPDAKSKQRFDNIFTVVIFLVLPSIITMSIKTVIEGFFPKAPDAIFAVIGVAVYVLAVITIIKTIAYSKIRVYCYSYLLYVRESLTDKTTCPRCGGSLNYNKRSKKVKVKIGERRYYRKLANGQEEVTVEDITKDVEVDTSFYTCTNPKCQMSYLDELPQFKSMPHTVAMARAMIFGEPYMGGTVSIKTATMQVNPLMWTYAAIAVLILGLGYIQYANYEETTYCKIIERGEEISSAEMLKYLENCSTHEGDFQISIKNEPSGYFNYIFSGTINDEGSFKYDSDTGAWVLNTENVNYYYLNNGKHEVKSYRKLDTEITNWISKDRVNDWLNTADQYMPANTQDFEAIRNMLSGEKRYKNVKCAKQGDVYSISVLDEGDYTQYYFDFQDHKMISARAEIDGQECRLTFSYDNVDAITPPDLPERNTTY